MHDDNKTVVKIDAELRHLIPKYFETKRQDILSIADALERADYEFVRITGHSMKGSGGGYGFDRITEIGRYIEQAAVDKDDSRILKGTEMLRRYMEKVEIIFE